MASGENPRPAPRNRNVRRAGSDYSHAFAVSRSWRLTALSLASIRNKESKRRDAGVPALVAKGYRGQALTDKLNEVLSLGKDGGLTRAVVTKAIRAEAWRRQAEAEERNDTDALSKAKLVIETLGLHGPKTETADTASLVVKPSRRKKSVKKIQPGTGAVFGKVPASNQGAATQQRAAKPQQEVL